MVAIRILRTEQMDFKPRHTFRNISLMGLVCLFVFLSLLVYGTTAHAELYMFISGTVKDAESGTKVAGTGISAISKDDHGKYYSATTDSKGDFVLKYVSAGTYDLYIDPPSTYVKSIKPYKIIMEKGKNIVELNIHLERGGGISGKVFQSDGVTPVKRALIIAYTSEDNVSYGTTNDRGEYVISGVRETDTGSVVVLPDGFVGVLRENISILCRQTSHMADFVLTPDLTTGITGTVTSQDGYAIANAMVLLFGVNSASKTTTDGSGRFSILGLASGAYSAVVMAQDFEPMKIYSIRVFSGELTLNNYSMSSKSVRRNETEALKTMSQYVGNDLTKKDSQSQVGCGCNLSDCLNAWAAGGQAIRNSCAGLPPGPVRAACWGLEFASETFCRGWCFWNCK